MEIHLTTNTEFNMAGLPKYVADSPLGGRVDLGGLVGSQAAVTDDAGTEDYWPRIPPNYGPPPAHLENAVKEGDYKSLPWFMKVC